MSGDNEEIVVELNLDNPANQELRDFLSNATCEEFGRFSKRFLRRAAFNESRQEIGDVSGVVARGLLRMFKAGYMSGHAVGYEKGEADAKTTRRATDGR